MPPESIGFAGTLFLYPQRVRIVAGRHEAVHDRFPSTAAGSIDPKHRAQMLASVSGRRGKLYFKRQSILDLGPDAETRLTEIVHRHPRTWKGEVEILFDHPQRFGEERLVRALDLAVSKKLFGAQSVAAILAKEVA